MSSDPFAAPSVALNALPATTAAAPLTVTVTGDVSETDPETATAAPRTYDPAAGCAMRTAGLTRSMCTSRTASPVWPAESVATTRSATIGPAPSGTSAAAKFTPSTVAATPFTAIHTGEPSTTVPRTSMLVWAA